MDLDLLRAKQPNFQHKKKNGTIRAIIPLNLILSLHTLPANPKVGIASFTISLIILLMNPGTYPSTSSPQPL